MTGFARLLLAALLLVPTGVRAQETPQIVAIGAVQGAVSDSDRGTAHQSPSKDQTVTVRGVVTQLSLQRASSGALNRGFYLQNTSSTADSDPHTSDGIFVFVGSRSFAIDNYQPSPGDEIVLTGRVEEFFNMTELVAPRVLEVVRQNVTLDAEVPTFEAQPPDDLAEAQRYWERHEGMRARVPAGAIVLGGRDVFSATEDNEIWIARGDSAIAQRADPFTRRAFRDAHPLDDRPETLFDNGNGYRIVLGNSGLQAAMNAIGPLPPARTFDTVTNDLVGPVLYTFGKYRIEVGAPPALAGGADPDVPLATFDRNAMYSVASFNLENLYDFRDDPFDGCDFTGNEGCPGVRPPFDYVPASDRDYRLRLAGLAQQIVEDLLSPDLLLVQEIEDQDICRIADGAMVCGAEDNADGQPDALEDLALAIQALGGPAYIGVLDRDGADDRGIVSGFLYRSDRVQRLTAGVGDPILSAQPRVTYRGDPLDYNADVSNPKALNARLPGDVDRSTGTDGSNVYTRAAQVGLFRIDGTTLYAVSNHFSSGPDSRIGQRREQAAYAAAIAEALLSAQPGTRLVIGGDLNVYPRPDDPVVPPSDQLGPLYRAGLANLWDRQVAESPAGAYSYVFDGQAQTLDQLFVSPALLDDLSSVAVAHINADWAAANDAAGPRGLSDHDPPRAVFRVATQTLPNIGTK